MANNMKNSNDAMQTAKNALQRMFYHYQTSRQQKNSRSGNWNYLGFALALNRPNQTNGKTNNQ